MLAADGVIVPAQLEDFGIQGVAAILDAILTKLDDTGNGAALEDFSDVLRSAARTASLSAAAGLTPSSRVAAIEVERFLEAEGH